MGTIRVRNLGKAYKRYEKRVHRLAEWLTAQVHHTPCWVLRGLSFEVAAGEAVALIGHNGAGKSTALKLITGTTSSTEGTVECSGRIAALLELGIGFQPVFTGRQNVFISGQLMGLDNATITRLMPDIEAFAEIGDYMDQPVRTYSSGMQVRLAFSVATAVRPDILIVDEALSVGDSYFQHKSFARIRQFRDEGTTLLFVSHSAAAVKTLCDRAILLDDGVMIKDGTPDEVLDYYNAVVAKRQADYEIRAAQALVGKKVVTRSGDGRASIGTVELLDEHDAPAVAFRATRPMKIRIPVHLLQDIDDLTVGILLRDRLGNDMYGTNTFHLKVKPNAPLVAGADFVCEFDIAALQLGQGHYHLTVALHSHDSHVENNYDWWDNTAVFQVVPADGPLSIGCCHMVVSGRLVGVALHATS